MRLLFAYDHRFFRGPGGEVHTSGAFPAWVWDRYLDHFDEVTVIARDGGPVPPERAWAVPTSPESASSSSPTCLRFASWSRRRPPMPESARR